LADENAAAILFWEALTVIEGQTQRGGVCSDGEVGNVRLGDQIGAFAFAARVFVAAEVGIGPAVEGAVLHAGDVLVDEIVAQFVTFGDGSPEHAGVWIRSYRRGYEVRKRSAEAGAVGIHFEDAGASLFFLPAMLANVARGADSAGGTFFPAAVILHWPAQ
jgi:hypothetical protein